MISRWDENRVKRENHLPHPAAHAAFDAAQGVVSFALGCLIITGMVILLVISSLKKQNNLGASGHLEVTGSKLPLKALNNP